MDQCQSRMTREVPRVVIVDDDESVREALPEVVRQLGHTAQVFASAEEFLASGAVSGANCLIVDIGLPGMPGPALQRELIRRGYSIPTVFITARSKDSVPPGLLRDGGVACLLKPFSSEDLREALARALQRGN